MAGIVEPRGQRWMKSQTNYQLFPEEYFSAADVNIYFNDIWMDELTGLSFKLTEHTKPIYGYASKTWDYFCRGKRFVQGYFKIAFREAGYLFTVLDHIGQLKDDYPGAPALSYLMSGQSIPKWHGHVKERLEDLLMRWGRSEKLPLPMTTGRVEERIVPPWPEDFLKRGMTGLSVQILQENLKWEHYYDGPINGIFDEATEEAVKKKQAARGEAVTGIVGQTIKRDYSKTEYISIEGNPLDHDPNGWAEPRMVQYEKEVWGRPFVSGGEEFRKHESFFYRGRESVENGLHTAPLMQRGIDIYINYGPLAEYLRANNYKINQTASINTTVKAIRNVQITNVSQVIDPNTGDVIEEMYEFWAQDLD